MLGLGRAQVSDGLMEPGAHTLSYFDRVKGASTPALWVARAGSTEGESEEGCLRVGPWGPRESLVSWLPGTAGEPGEWARRPEGEPGELAAGLGR